MYIVNRLCLSVASVAVLLALSATLEAQHQEHAGEHRDPAHADAQPQPPATQRPVDEEPDDPHARPAARIEVTPQRLTLKVGESAELNATALDEEGHKTQAQIFYFSRDFRAVEVTREGKVTALRPGAAQIVASARSGPQSQRVRTTIEVTVPPSPVARIEFAEPRTTVLAGTTVTFQAQALDETGSVREDVRIAFEPLESVTAMLDEHGRLTAHRPGTIDVVARLGEFSAKTICEVVPNPVHRVTLALDRQDARTGDVIHAAAEARDVLGRTVPQAEVQYSLHLVRDEENNSHGAAGQVGQDGRFVAERPGEYRIVATAGGRAAHALVSIRPRDIGQNVQVVGRGPVRDVHTSDLWVWEGIDGRDYCVTGTWGADGEAYFWDVTDPEKIERIASVKVDARTVNDVKVSADGRICVISREGASNRRNGIVIYDVSDPRSVRLLSAYDDGLTGGVHNVFIYEDHVYAINNGRRYDVINIENPTAPRRVARFEIDQPNHGVHDVWVVDGIAYSSNFAHGLYLVDVGSGVAGGAPHSPVKIDNYTYPDGFSHAAFPYFSSAMNKLLVVAGDELFPTGLAVRQRPTIPAGYIHFVDFTIPNRPLEVARYEIPEAGSHNFWIVDDTLYVAYYNAGLRVVDISGELMGDLYRQGREIARFLPFDAESVVPNAAMTWGPQPHKGIVYLSDWNSGLWAVKLVPKRTSRR